MLTYYAICWTQELTWALQHVSARWCIKVSTAHPKQYKPKLSETYTQFALISWPTCDSSCSVRRKYLLVDFAGLPSDTVIAFSITETKLRRGIFGGLLQKHQGLSCTLKGCLPIRGPRRWGIPSLYQDGLFRNPPTDFAWWFTCNNFTQKITKINFPFPPPVNPLEK